MTMSDPAATARHLVLHGRVQGVFYRDWTVKTARSFGLTGWVRNLPDGSVEAHLEGDPRSVDSMITAMRKGPAHADVERIDVRQADVSLFSIFERR